MRTLANMASIAIRVIFTTSLSLYPIMLFGETSLGLGYSQSKLGLVQAESICSVIIYGMGKAFTITVKTPKLRKGHQAHRSGAGTMGDRRLGRLKTRATQFRNAIKE